MVNTGWLYRCHLSIGQGGRSSCYLGAAVASFWVRPLPCCLAASSQAPIACSCAPTHLSLIERCTIQLFYTVQLSLPTPAMHCTASFSLRQCTISPSHWHALCSHATTQLPSRSPPLHNQLLQPEVAGGRDSEDRLPRRRRGSLPDCQGRQRPPLAAPPPPPSLPLPF